MISQAGLDSILQGLQGDLFDKEQENQYMIM
jgi:hypothetical protein